MEGYLDRLSAVINGSVCRAAVDRVSLDDYLVARFRAPLVSLLVDDVLADLKMAGLHTLLAGDELILAELQGSRSS